MLISAFYAKLKVVIYINVYFLNIIAFDQFGLAMSDESLSYNIVQPYMYNINYYIIR